MAFNQAAIAFSKELLGMDDKTTHWIARDTLKELQSEKIQQRVRKNKQRKQPD